MRARLARFYGWSDSEISELTYTDFIRYHKVMKNIKAEENLNDMSIFSYPHMKKSQAREFFKKVKRMIKSGLSLGSNKSVKQQALDAMGRASG